MVETPSSLSFPTLEFKPPYPGPTPTGTKGRSGPQALEIWPGVQDKSRIGSDAQGRDKGQ